MYSLATRFATITRFLVGSQAIDIESINICFELIAPIHKLVEGRELEKGGVGVFVVPQGQRVVIFVHDYEQSGGSRQSAHDQRVLLSLSVAVLARCIPM